MMSQDFSPSQFTPSQNAADSTTPFKMRGASGTMPLTVKQIADAHQSGTGEKGAPFVVDGVETANIRLVGMVNGKTERNTDVSFTLDDGTGRLDFIRWEITTVSPGGIIIITFSFLKEWYVRFCHW
nr:unnamed protein product [Digitaria exilis]